MLGGARVTGAVVYFDTQNDFAAAAAAEASLSPSPPIRPFGSRLLCFGRLCLISQTLLVLFCSLLINVFFFLVVRGGFRGAISLILMLTLG